jgi:hypothetical protein
MYLDISDERFGEMGFERNLRSPYNLLQGAVDSTMAHIVTQRPRPMLMTIGGNGPLRRLARRRQRWLDGEYHRLKVYQKSRKMVLDSLMYGAGCLKIDAKNGRNTLERVWCGDLWTDPREERFDCVRTLYQLHAIDRGVLIKRYPEHEAAIRGVKETIIDDIPFPDMKTYGYQSPALINVIEAWRLPTSKDCPGRHVLVIDTATLEDEKWEDEDFPFLIYRWADKSMSWWGQGMVERGAGMQSDLNELCSTIRESYETFVMQTWAKEGSVDVTTMDDTVGKINKYKGDTPPMHISPAINPTILQQEERMATRFYSVLGVNQMSAAAVKPAGVESGKGLQVLNDTTTTRFVPNEQQYEEVVAVELAEKLTCGARRQAKKGHKQTVYGGSHTRGGMRSVDFPDTIPKDQDENEVFFLRPFPVPNLSNSVSQRYDDIERMEQNGAFPDPRMKRELMAVPDIDGYIDRDLAGSDLVEEAIERALEGENVSPDSYWPHAEAMVRIGQAIQLAQIDQEKPDGVERLRNLHQALMEMPVNGTTGMTTVPTDPQVLVQNTSAAVPTGPVAEPPIPGGIPPQGPMQ